MMSEELNPLESLRATISSDSRDWSQSEKDAWMYGIIIGWGNALSDVAKLHNWDIETISRLRQLRIKLRDLRTSGALSVE